MKSCPKCGGEIQDRANKCRHCLSWLTPGVQKSGALDPAPISPHPQPLSREEIMRPAPSVETSLPAATTSGRSRKGRLSARQVIGLVSLAATFLGVGTFLMLKSSSREPGSSSVAPLANPTVSPSETDAAFIAHVGVPPIWPATPEETDAVFYDLVYGGKNSELSSCKQLTGDYEVGLISGGNALESCLTPHLAGLGVQDEALDLLFETGIVIWNATPTGPFWLAEGFDYDDFGSNGGPPTYLFTPQGILDIAHQWNTWQILSDAKAASMEGEMPEIQRAYASAFGMSDSDIGFWPYGENFHYSTPVSNGDAWVIPFSVPLEGCHACETPIQGSFELDADSGGVIFGARFVGLCYDASYQPNDSGDIPGGNQFGLSDCPGSQPAPEADADEEERIVDASCGEEYCAGIWKSGEGAILFEAWGIGDYFGTITVCVEKVTRVCAEMDPEGTPAGAYEWRLAWADNFPDEGSGIYSVTMTSEGGNPVGDGAWDFEWNSAAAA